MNKHWKVLIAILLVAVLVIGVVGCGKKTEDPDDTKDTTPVEDNNDDNTNDDEDDGDENGDENGDGGNTDDGEDDEEEDDEEEEGGDDNTDDEGGDDNTDDEGGNEGGNEGGEEGGQTPPPPTVLPGSDNSEDLAYAENADNTAFGKIAFSGADDAQPVKLIGFNNGTRGNENGVWLDWAGAGLEMKVNLSAATDVSVTVDAYSPVETAYCAFLVYVDGALVGEAVEIECNVGEDWIIFPVAAGEHTIKIVKISDAKTAYAFVKEVEFEGTFVAPVADDKLAVEFIGDDLTVGEDLTKSYAWILAANYNYQLTAWNGAALADIAGAYTKAAPVRNGDVGRNFVADADVVVVNIGAVDYALAAEADSVAASEAAFAKAYKDLLVKVRAYNADAKILCVYGALNDGYSTQIEAVVAELGAGYYTLALNAVADATAVTEAEQQAIATAIGAKITEIKDVNLGGNANLGAGSTVTWADGVAVQ